MEEMGKGGWDGGRSEEGERGREGGGRKKGGGREGGKGVGWRVGQGESKVVITH